MTLGMIRKIAGFNTFAGVSSVPYSESSGTPAESDGGGVIEDASGQWAITREFAVDNDATITHIGLYCTDAQTVHVALMKRDSSTQYDFIVVESFSHPGGGWANKALPSPVTLDGSSIYYVGVLPSSTPIDRRNHSYPRAFTESGAPTTATNNVAVTESDNKTPAMRVVGTKP